MLPKGSANRPDGRKGGSTFRRTPRYKEDEHAANRTLFQDLFRRKAGGQRPEPCTCSRGEIVGFIGHNGAGKSTTLRACAGVLDFTEGTIRIDGHDIRREPLAAKRVTAFFA